jgi:hypothetical protein
MMRKNKNCSWLISVALVMGFVMAGCGSSPAVAPVDLTGVTSYYVRADGNDANAGTSEDAPFKTLAKAVEAAAKTTVKKITVIGTLAGNTKIENADPTVLSTEIGYQVRVVELNGQKTTMVDTTKPATLKIKGSYDEHDPDSITITGKPGASGAERAVLTSAGGDYTVLIINSTVVFENIEISGNPTDPALFIQLSRLALGAGTKIINNTSTEAGKMEYGDGGGIAAVTSILVMRDDAEVSGNKGTEQGGGLFLQECVLAMRNNSKIAGNTAGRSGGGVCLQASTLEMYDAAQISGNVSSDSGGGIAAFSRNKKFYSSITMNGDSRILSNKAVLGGGVALVEDALITLNDSALVSDNTATQAGGGVLGFNNTTQVTKNENAVIANNTAPEVPDTNFTFN